MSFGSKSKSNEPLRKAFADSVPEAHLARTLLLGGIKPNDHRSKQSRREELLIFNSPTFMDDSPAYTFIGGASGHETEHGSINRCSRLFQQFKPLETTSGRKKSVIHFSFDADNNPTVEAFNSFGPIQAVVENGFVRRESRIRPNAIDAAVRKTPFPTQRSESRSTGPNTFPTHQSADHNQKRKCNSNTKSVIPGERFAPQLRDARSNSISRPHSETVTSDSYNFLNSALQHHEERNAQGDSKRASQVKAVGHHVLVKRFTASSKAIQPPGSRAIRSYNSFLQPVLNNTFPRTRNSSTGNISVNVNSSLSSERASARGSGTAQPPVNVNDSEPDVDFRQKLLEKFSAKAIDAAVRFTPSETSSAGQPIPDKGLLKKFSQRAISAAVNPTTFPVKTSSSSDGSTSSFEGETERGIKPQDPEEEAEITSRQSTVQGAETIDTAVDSGCNYGATNGIEAEQEPIVEVPRGDLFQRASSKVMDPAVKSIPSQVADSIHEETTSSNSDDELKPVVEPQQGLLLEKFAAKVIEAATSSSGADQHTSHPQPVERLAASINAAMKAPVPPTEGSSGSISSTADFKETSFKRNRSSKKPLLQTAAHDIKGFQKNFSPEANNAEDKRNPSSAAVESRTSRSSRSSLASEEPVVEEVHGLVKKFPPEATDSGAVHFIPWSEENLDNAESKKDTGSESTDLDADSPTPPGISERNNITPRVNVAPPKMFGPRAKKGGVLDTNEPKAVRICTLGVPGRVLYLEVYKDFVDLLVSLLTMRTGAVIKLLREVDIGLNFGGPGGGILNIYDSLSKMDETILTETKDNLLDPNHKLKLTKELRCLGSFERECCNPECPKYVSSSRVVCKNCIVTSHFSCSLCNAYFRENVHSTACYAPWRPWGIHASAAPVLNRYTVVQSIDAIVAPKSQERLASQSVESGFVKPGIPFMITDDLNIRQLTSQSIARILKTIDYENGETEELDCHELLIGKTEVPSSSISVFT
ncbi:hypothetical protein R1flu_021490 [Riccia fluitans]|uniref:Uncharacterized protein n=1 Tax=Riccia fluitans TaxID=41844 RepID=A0ABD1ZQN9_9MARC